MCIIACICLSEERKKAKLSYQESLQNVHTVRQQVKVRKLQLSDFTYCFCFFHYTLTSVWSILYFQEAKQAGQKRERAASDAGEESVKPNIKASKTESETSVPDQSTKPAQKKKKQKKVQEPEVPQQNFKPYDYSQSNFKMFDGKRSAFFFFFFFLLVSSFVCILYSQVNQKRVHTLIQTDMDPSRRY